MASIKISELAAVQSVTGDDVLIVNDGDVNTRKITYTNLTSNLISTGGGQTINGDLTITGNLVTDGLVVDTDLITVDTVNDRIGILSTTPATTLDVGGNIQIRDGAALRWGDADTSAYVSFQAPAVLGSNTPYTLPGAYPTSDGQFLAAQQDGALNWVSGLLDPMTTVGDMIVRNLQNTTARLPRGSAGQVLTVQPAGDLAWQNNSSGFADPMTTPGDIIFRNALNVTARFGIGSPGQALTVNAGGELSWVEPTAGAGGADTQVQYNDNGVLGGDATFTFNETANRLTVQNATVTDDLIINGNTVLGDVAADLITANGSFSTPLIPNNTGALNLGSTTNRWGDLFMADSIGMTEGGAIGGIAFDNLEGYTFSGLGNGNATARIQIMDEQNNNGITLAAPTSANLNASYTLTLPLGDGDPGQVLRTDGAGVLSWINQSGGSDLAVQDDGVAVVAAATTLNFTGAGVAVTANGNVANIAIAGGGGAANPAGNNTELQFNNNGAFGADANLTFDSAGDTGNGELTAAGAIRGRALFGTDTITTPALTAAVPMTITGTGGITLDPGNPNETVIVNGNINLTEDVDLGNASTDTISINGSLDTSIIPATDSVVNLGSDALRWQEIFVDEVTTDSIVGPGGASASQFPITHGTSSLTMLTGFNQYTFGGGGANNNGAILEVEGASGTPGRVQLDHQGGSTQRYDVILSGPTTNSTDGGNTNYTITFPNNAPQAAQILQTDANGQLSWIATPGGGAGTPGGTNTQVQFNDNGAFGGDAGLTFDANVLTVASQPQISDGLVAVRTGSGTAGAIDLFCEVSNLHRTRIQSGPHAGYTGGNVTLTLPTVAPPNAGDVLEAADTAGTLQWVTPATGGTPAGANLQVQWNNNGAFGASDRVTFNNATGTTIGGLPECLLTVGDNPGDPGATSFGSFNADAVTAAAALNSTGNFSVIADQNGVWEFEGITGGTPTLLSFNNTLVNINNGGQLSFQSQDNNGAVSFIGPAVLTGLNAYTLPNALPANNGDVLSCTTAGVMSWAVAGGGGGLPTRTTATAATPAINDQQNADIAITTNAPSLLLQRIETDQAAWVRVYTSDAARTADAARLITDDPAPGSGVLAEIVTTGAAIQAMTPVPSCYFDADAAGTRSNDAFLAVQNLSGGNTTINITLTYVALEAQV